MFLLFEWFNCCVCVLCCTNLSTRLDATNMNIEHNHNELIEWALRTREETNKKFTSTHTHTRTRSFAGGRNIVSFWVATFQRWAPKWKMQHGTTCNRGKNPCESRWMKRRKKSWTWTRDDDNDDDDEDDDDDDLTYIRLYYNRRYYYSHYSIWKCKRYACNSVGGEETKKKLFCFVRDFISFIFFVLFVCFS